MAEVLKEHSIKLDNNKHLIYKHNKLVASAKTIDGIIKFDNVLCFEKNDLFANSTNVDKNYIWHRRFNHLNYNY